VSNEAELYDQLVRLLDARRPYGEILRLARTIDYAAHHTPKASAQREESHARLDHRVAVDTRHHVLGVLATIAVCAVFFVICSRSPKVTVDRVLVIVALATLLLVYFGWCLRCVAAAQSAGRRALELLKPKGLGRER